MVTRPEAWGPDPTLVNEVRSRLATAISVYTANPDLISEHANHEESIRVGGYSDRTLLELVQNAADALSGVANPERTAGRVEIVLDTESQTLYCANTGRPFSKNGLVTIMHAHLSDKRGDEIGRFGLGFKSVLAVSDAPQVFSRSVSFEFNSPQARSAISSVAATAKRYPILRTATALDPLAAFESDPILAGMAEWATTIVKLPRARGLARLRSDIERFPSEFLLFVGTVREITLRVLGTDSFETTHVSRDLGDGILKIERPDGSGDEWIVQNRMHTPTAEARRQVGEAVSREQVKVTVAVPRRQARQRIGQFWSYFPLQDQTSASALFNAPWSVNDDRTTLLRNDYNREMVRTLSGMFVSLLPLVSTAEDPAAHLDYMPARGREPLSFGDELLCAHVPRMSAKVPLVPDATGTLKPSASLRPLDLGIVGIKESDHLAWADSPNTADDVPHWRCYASTQRAMRLRQLLTAAASPDLLDSDRDAKRALDSIPKRGLLSWLREWAEGDDVASAADAIKFVLLHRNLPDVDQARVVPTTDGMRALRDKNIVFLHQEDGVEIERAVFVDPELLARSGVESALREFGFRDLDPLAILNARLAKLTADPNTEQLTKLWEAILDVPVTVAAKTLANHRAVVKVPTQDGNWAWPTQVFDLDEPLGDNLATRLLDHQRCMPVVAHQIGVVHRPVGKYALEDEPLLDRYREWVLTTINSRRGPGERPVERIELYPGDGPGPFSVLFFLKDAKASDRIRAAWTAKLLQESDGEWICEDLDTGASQPVMSPVRWAADRAGLLESNRGFRPPGELVAPSMLKYRNLLPIFQGPRQVADALEMPDELSSVPPSVLKEALEAQIFPSSLDDTALAEFITAARRIAYPDSRPETIPARVQRAIEARSPASVYLATTDEQEEFLSSRQRPYLRVTEEQEGEFTTLMGCRRFEESFAFSVVIDGEQKSERVVDLFSGLRAPHIPNIVTSATVTRALQIVKRVTTEDGVEDQSLEWHLDGSRLTVSGDADERRLLNIVNEAFNLRLTNAELDDVLQAGIDHRLERLRQEAKAASTDAERLDIYFGPDDLREALPKGLWHALASQGLVDDSTSAGELILTVYGSDAISQLADQFQNDGFTDVPRSWAGGAATISWLRKMGFGAKYAGRHTERQEGEFIVPGAVKLSPLHDFQEKISQQLKDVLTLREANGHHLKAMVELPTGAGKTRVAAETVLRLFIDGGMRGPVLWIAQSQELCEQAVQTWSTVWRGLGDDRPLTVCRLWDTNNVHEPDTDFSVIVATDAKLDVILESPEYMWLKEATAVIIDEGHRAGGSERYTRILNWLGVAGRSWERPLVGLSATPFKGTSEAATAALSSRFGDRKINIFDTVSAYRALTERRVLAQVEHEVLPGIEFVLAPDEIAEAEEKRRIPSRVMGRIGADQARMSILVEHILSLDKSWPVLVFTPDVLSAQVLAATLRYRAVAAKAVSGQTSRQERRDIIEQFKRNEIRVLTNCDLLAQGFDAPGVRALYIARPTFSPNAYIQMAGRGLRGPENGGKEKCLIVDIADNFGAFTDWLGYREYEPLWQEPRS